MFVTVRDYLSQYPDIGIDLLTPAGLVSIPSRQGQELLSPGGGKRRFSVSGSNTKILASDLLEQRICKIVRYDRDPWRVFMLTDLPSALVRKNYHPELIFEQISFLSE